MIEIKDEIKDETTTISPYFWHHSDNLFLNSNNSESFTDQVPFLCSLNNPMSEPFLLKGFVPNNNLIDLSNNNTLYISIVVGHGVRQRQRKRKRYINKNYPRCFDLDSIIKKIKVHYTNKFLIKFINIIIGAKCQNIHNKYCDLKFYPLLYNKATKDNINELRELTIKDVIKTYISRRYKKTTSDGINPNVKLCQKIEEEDELKDINDILELKFFYFYEKIYIQKKEKKKINLKEFKLFDLEMDLSQLQLFDDLKLKNKKKDNYDIYEIRMEKYKNFFLNPKLKFNIFKTRKMKK